MGKHPGDINKQCQKDRRIRRKQNRRSLGHVVSQSDLIGLSQLRGGHVEGHVGEEEEEDEDDHNGFAEGG